MKVNIFNVQRMSLHDGPGIRTTIFFKGCNMRCVWCHNPESWERGAAGEGEGEIARIDNLAGAAVEIDKIIEEAEKDRLMYEISGGGVTCSGGEPLLQIRGLSVLLQQLKRKGICTAVDTAGNVPGESFEEIMPYTDLFLYDLKLWDSEEHKKYTGTSNEKILMNFETIEKEKRVIVRIPVIAGISETVFEPFADFLKGRKNLEYVEILPYHNLGEKKYQKLGRKNPMFKAPTTEFLEEKSRIFKKYDIKVKLNGKFQ